MVSMSNHNVHTNSGPVLIDSGQAPFALYHADGFMNVANILPGTCQMARRLMQIIETSLFHPNEEVCYNTFVMYRP
jgi:hypothetical protein